MTIQQLKYILALDKTKNFIKAAEISFVTQPTITQQLKKIEDEIGLQIFDRNSFPLKTTPIGQEIVTRAKYILSEIQNLKDFVNEDRNNLNSIFKIGVIPTIFPFLIHRIINELKNILPDAKFEFYELQTEFIIDKLKLNELDLGILATPLNDKNLKEYLLYNENLVLYGNNISKHQFSISDLKNIDNIMILDNGHCLSEQIKILCDKNFTDNAINTNSLETLISIINKIGGYTIIPQLCVNQLDKMNINYFEDEIKPSRAISIVTNNNFYKLKIINILKEIIQKNIPKELINDNKKYNVKWR